MNRFRRDNAGLVLGLISLGAAVCFGMVRGGYLTGRNSGMILAGVLIAAGLFGLTISGGSQQRRAQQRRAAQQHRQQSTGQPERRD